MKKTLTILFVTFGFLAIAQQNPGLVLKINGKSIPTASAAFGPVLELDKPLCADVVLVDSKGGATPTANTKLEGCDTIYNSAALAGKIALIRRGTCNFNVKVANAQKAGAIAVIIFDNVANAVPATLTGTDATITIPSCRISLEDGNILVADLKANKPTNACLVAPSRVVDNVYGNRFYNTMPLSQADSISPLISIINKSVETIAGVTIFADIIAPDGSKATVQSQTEDVPPTNSGSVWIVPLSNYSPKQAGTYKVNFYGNFSPDTSKTQFIISNDTYANDNGVLTGTGTGRTAATFASQFKKYSHLNYYQTGKTGAKATYATFGIINAAQMKNRTFKVTLWESSEDKLKAIGSAVSSVDAVAEFPVGDEINYKMVGTEKSLITVKFTDGNQKYIKLEPETVYVLAVEYDGIAYADSIVPQYTLARNNPTRWLDFSIFGTAVMSGTTYFGGGWNGTEDPVGRLHIDNFVGAEDLQQLEQDEVNIFPNPTTGMVNLKLDLKENHKKVELGIMDMMGRILNVYTLDTQKGIIPINISSYPAGTYFFTVKTDKAFTTEKVIKE